MVWSMFCYFVLKEKLFKLSISLLKLYDSFVRGTNWNLSKLSSYLICNFGINVLFVSQNAGQIHREEYYQCITLQSLLFHKTSILLTL